MDGDHDIERCAEASENTWSVLFSELHTQRVMLEGLLLKTNMVLPGKASPNQVSMEKIAQATVDSLLRTVPPAMPGVVFLSGGQGPQEATERLNAMNAMFDLPWELSFSYGRALQQPSLDAWKGEEANMAAGQAALYHRAMCNGAARDGRYSDELEKAA